MQGEGHGAADPDQELMLAWGSLESGDVDGLVAHLSAAVRGYTAQERPRAAAMACAQLGEVFATMLGNLTAGRAWFARAVRMVENEPPCLEQGWVAVAAMGCDVDDPDELLVRADLALDRARRFGDLNLEAKALADGGLARVRLGRVDEGMGWLDEAMALVCGPADDVQTAGKAVCSFFTACYTMADFARADAWTGLLRRRRVIGDERGAASFLRSHCDSLQAAMLVELGRWSEAEAVLARSIADFERVNQAPSWHPAIALAELRVRQGRFAEAEALLLRKDAWIEGLLPAAQLHLARLEHDLALAAARRGLKAVGADRIRAAQLASVEVEALLGLGDIAAAARAADEMDRRVGDLAVPALRARNLAVRANVHEAVGDGAAAVDALAGALDAVDGLAVPWLRASILLDLAARRERLGDLAGARLDARAAAQALVDLDVVLRPDQAATLSRLAPSAPFVAMATDSPTAALRRVGKGWIAGRDGVEVRLADSKGLRYLAELMARPGVEQHALDLVDRVEGVSDQRGLDRRSLGDAGPVLDAAARADYRRRIEQMRAEIDDAMAIGNDQRAESLQDELDALVSQLAQAFGLGGRSRVAASATERARLNVTRAVRAAITRISEVLPAPGAALDRHVRTGIYCAYDPPPGDDGVRWIVQS